MFDLLQFPETRIGALRLFESLSSHAYDPKTASIAETSPVAEVGNAFSRVMEAIQFIPRDDLDFRLEVLKTIKRIFKAHQSTRDIFRRVGGYVSLVSMIVALEGAFDEPQRFFNTHITNLESVRSKITDVIQTIFSVLAESMHNHHVNKKYFLKDVGYESLENAITLTGALNKDGIPRQVFGVLFAFAIDDDTVYDLFVDSKEEEANDDKSMTLDLMKRIELVLKSHLTKVINPEIMPTILHLQEVAATDIQLSRAVLCAVYALAQGSRRNQVKMNASGLVLVLLKRAFPKENKEANTYPERDIMIQIIKKLMAMGVSFDELRYMFQGFNVESHLENSFGLMDLVLQGASRSRWPNFIQFDLESSERTSLEVPQLNNFPPTTPGYTLLFWIYIERQDNTSNLSLFSVWDDATLVFKISIDAQSKMIHIFNVASRQDAVFKSFEFHSGFWYHISLVHQKSRLSVKSSIMSLYVNGVYIEQTSCAYVPQPVIAGIPLKGVIGASNIEHQSAELVWDLGPTYLIQDTLEKETINLFFNLGARYKSLFQDSLRQFQTYEASAALFLTLRSMSQVPMKTRDSVQAQNMLANVMKGAHFQNVPESKIILAFFGSNTLAEGSGTGLTLTGVSGATAATIATEIDCSHLILNSAIPKLDTAIYMPKNMGYLTGSPTIAYPFGLDESMGKIGGCAIALKLIERAEVNIYAYLMCQCIHYAFHYRLQRLYANQQLFCLRLFAIHGVILRIWKDVMVMRF